MINANEMRLGNIVQDEISGEPMIVVEIGENVGASVINRDKFPLQDGWAMAPIALTEEWLQRFGFIKGNKETNRNLFYASGAHSAIHSVSLSGGVMLHRTGNKMLLERHIDSVHQLQNLYFALTGEELKIKS